MNLGLGLYRHLLTRENFQFARQAGATHIVAHLVDYFKGGAHNPSDNQPTGTEQGWGLAGDPDRLWTLEELVQLRQSIEAEGLRLEAIENFDPAHWHDVLLDGPKKAQQLKALRRAPLVTPTDLTGKATTDIAGAMAKNKKVQLKGTWNREKESAFNSSTSQFTFYLVDDAGRECKVVLDGAAPNNFEMATSVVAKGKFTSDGYFHASEVLTKCPSKYEATGAEVTGKQS